eukprot:TRINITY_DN2085_c0_g1_i9.p2 TRINITY_DN2085_c0_g1~~TRINITY_DN2085_c0_g1_i9.p2  ORF type:complete len:108 (-),score=16.90 TRINITY_DN2085_c0_g1_i9:165-488(-)
MIYLRHVLDESLRLWPPVPVDFRRSVAADTLPDGTPIPPDSTVVYSPYILGRNEKHWKDATKFQPERWEDNDTNTAFIVFHAGPQTCLGRSMAYLEAKTLTTLLLQH